MRLPAFFISILFVCCKTNSQTESFPAVSKTIDSSFKSIDKLFPVAMLDISSKGYQEKIPIIYAYFTEHNNENEFLRKGDNISCYSFQKMPDGKYKPLFTEKALSIDKSYEEYFKSTVNHYDSVKTKLNIRSFLEFPREPDWWQNDETPLTSNGKRMIYICELEFNKFILNDCKGFIFYDPENKIVTHVIQWD
jgi:hypothetical protein